MKFAGRVAFAEGPLVVSLSPVAACQSLRRSTIIRPRPRTPTFGAGRAVFDLVPDLAVRTIFAVLLRSYSSQGAQWSIDVLAMRFI